MLSYRVCLVARYIRGLDGLVPWILLLVHYGLSTYALYLRNQLFFLGAYFPKQLPCLFETN